MRAVTLFGLLSLSLSCHTYYEADLLEDPERCTVQTPSSPSCPQGLASKTPAPVREANPTDGRFVVHEWGTFTTLVDEEGAVFTWYPLLGAKPLPRFVSAQWFQTLEGQWHWGKGWDFSGKTAPIQGTVRMETPVLYFYSDKERELSVEVKFNNGYLTEWFPHAAVPIKNPNTIKWAQVRLTPNAKEEFLTEGESSEYYAARETDATPLVATTPNPTDLWSAHFDERKPPEVSQMIANAPSYYNEAIGGYYSTQQTQAEKFLFYRGVGSFEVPLSAAMVSSNSDEQKVVVKNQQGEDIPGMILFMRQGEKIWFQPLSGMKPGESKPVTLDLTAAPSGVEPVKEALVALLEEQHLYGREAQAMVKTWEEAWFEEGLRVFYIVPRVTTDNILPLTLSETPDELERVLVGRIDILTPGLRKEIEDATNALLQTKFTRAELQDQSNAQPFTKRLQALTSHGRFVQPVLAKLQAKTKDAAEQEMLRALVEELPQMQH